MELITSGFLLLFFSRKNLCKQKTLKTQQEDKQPNLKMGKRYEQAPHQRGYIDGR